MRNPRLHSPIGTGNPATHTLRRRRWRKTRIETKILEDRITGKIKPDTEQLDQHRRAKAAKRINQSINRSRRRNGTKSEESEKRKRDEAARRARRRTPERKESQSARGEGRPVGAIY